MKKRQHIEKRGACDRNTTASTQREKCEQIEELVTFSAMC